MTKEEFHFLKMLKTRIKNARDLPECIAAMSLAISILIDAEIERQEVKND